MDNTKAQDHYAASHAQAMAYLLILSERIEDAPAPSDDTNWSDVANMAHLVDQLKEIVEPA